MCFATCHGKSAVPIGKRLCLINLPEATTNVHTVAGKVPETYSRFRVAPHRFRISYHAYLSFDSNFFVHNIRDGEKFL
ncbi:hypothetical protein KCU93_g363, partial [Aureobasidium melanogenum]